jgi:hypothetical protein
VGAAGRPKHFALVSRTEIFSDEHFPVVQQLAIAPNMRRVWQLLSRHKVRPAGLKACGVDCQNADEKVLWDHGVRLFFLHAIPPSSPELRSIQTPKDRAAAAAPWISAAKLCRWAVENYPTSPELEAALLKSADYLDHVARQESRLDSPLLVQRHNKKRSDDVARAHVRVLVDLNRKLFGKVLTRTVATTATVALGRSVTERQVRNWAAN